MQLPVFAGEPPQGTHDQAPVSERAQAPELSPLIDYYVAGFELLRGKLETLRARTLERRTGGFQQSPDARLTMLSSLPAPTARDCCRGLMRSVAIYAPQCGMRGPRSPIARPTAVRSA